MITAHFAALNEVEKIQYFEAAANPILQKLITEELKTVEEQILTLDKRTEESLEEFCRRFDKLKSNRTLLIDFFDINQQVIKQVQNLHNN